MDTVTIVMLVSRKDFLGRLFAQLDFMDCDANKTNIFVMVDGTHDIYQAAEMHVLGSKFKIKKCIWRGGKQGGYIPGDKDVRRRRIAQIHNEVKQYLKDVPSKYILSLEDDTLFPANLLKKLLEDYQRFPYAGFITSLELGRWGMTAIGAYTADDVYDTLELTSLDPKLIKEKRFAEDKLIKVDAAGLYGCLIKTENYANHHFKVWNDNILGPDVDFGLALRQQGLLNYANLSLQCTHLIRGGEIKFDNSDIAQVKVSKVGDDRWQTELV